MFISEPTAPRSLKVVRVTHNTVTLSWMLPNMPNGIIRSYQVQYRIIGSSDGFTSIDTNDATTMYTVTGLTSDTKYTFQVRASTITVGPRSSGVTQRTSKYYYNKNIEFKYKG